MPRKLWTPLSSVRLAEREEVRAGRRIARRVARRERWLRWEAWWANLAKRLKIAATIVASAAGIASGAGPGWRAAKWAWRLIHSRDLADHPELPKTGQPTTAIDFVPRPPEQK